MSFEWTKESYVHGIWFVPHNPDNAVKFDWMGALWRETVNGPWCVTHRIRYLHSEDPWDEEDKKHWVSIQAPDLDDKRFVDGLKALQKMAEKAAEVSGTRVDYVDVQGDGEKAILEMSKQPWCHMKVEEKEKEGPF